MKRDWKEAREKVEEEGSCRYCGAANPDAAHIVPRSLGGGQSKASIVPLCRGCHTKYDHKQLDILSVLHLDEQMEAARTLGSLERAYLHLRGLKDPP